MRYRATIYLDVSANTLLEAEKQVNDLLLGLPNSFQAEVSELPHGSKISLK